MPLSFTLEVLGEEQVNRTFLNMSEKASNLQPLWEQMVKVLQNIAVLQFSSEGSHGSGGWEALAESTIAIKQSKGQQLAIERATNALFGSLTSAGSGSITEVASDYLRYGTSIPYAGFQQSGTRNMPQRRLVQLTEEERRQMANMVQKYIVTGEL